MFVERLTVKNFRNLSDVSLELSVGFNLFYGHNGSGKTSLLDGLCFLNTGRSHSGNNYIQNQEDWCVLTTQLADDSQHVRLGVKKSRQGKALLKVNNDFVKSWAEVTQWLPLQFMNPDSFALLCDGPKVRRSYMDWGLFYIEPSFYTTWRQTKRLLHQRNSLLKRATSGQERHQWDAQFIVYSEQLTSFRRSYVSDLMPLFNRIRCLLLPSLDIQMSFYAGWNEKHTLSDLLIKNAERDNMLGYTALGSHKADLRLSIDSLAVHHILSRGQLKLLACALKIAQTLLLEQQTGKRTLFLIDDLPSELDPHHRQILLEQLLAMRAQLLVTAIEPHAIIDMLSQKPDKVFHVKHGQVTEHKE
jgi:DNA replication and repair protein RecF